MDHIAIMKIEWKLIPKIIDGTKTVESRWYKSKVTPWNRIQEGNVLYFKDSGGSVSTRATVTKVDQYEIKDNLEAVKVMNRYALEDLGAKVLSDQIKNYISNKKYAVFIHFDKVKKIAPFEISKKGFGMQCAWITIPSVDNVKNRVSRSAIYCLI
jgi:predicted transcriptional regulator